MIELSRNAAAVLALVMGGWLAVSLWLSLRALRRGRAAATERSAAARTRALLDAGPAMPLIAHPDGSIEGDARLWPLLGFVQPPETLSGLRSDGAGLAPGDADQLTAFVADTRFSGSSFRLSVKPQAAARTLAISGGPVPAPWRPGSVLLWFADATEVEDSRSALSGEVARLEAAIDALSALIESAPFPMWYRGPDLRLALVNSAYVAAVEAEDAEAVIAAGTELVDEPDETVLAQAAQVRDSGEPTARNIAATIAGQRRTIRVVEVPLGTSGVAGYAIDVEDREQARAELARFVRAQRDMLDRLSAGVAQFARDRSLIFSNQPFLRLFSLQPEFLADRPEFERVIDAMRERGNLPEVRDFPAWKQDHRRWFTLGLVAEEEDWLLPGGRHLRVVAQPLPDGGLLLIFEDRTEQIQLASARDTLLRVRTATFDNLFEAIGVFASDGRLHLWNNKFRELWSFEDEQLSGNPRIDALVPHISDQLKNPSHAALLRELVRSATVERKQRTGRATLKDGRFFEFAAVPLPDGNALFTMLDVTDSRRIETALRERNEALEAADRVKSAFMSNVSYELRTPLTSIAGFAEMLSNGYGGELSPTALDYARAILDATAKLGTLIDEVLDLTQGDSTDVQAE